MDGIYFNFEIIKKMTKWDFIKSLGKHLFQENFYKLFEMKNKYNFTTETLFW
jgi:hypothetical protein